ncbi:glycyl-radical enzyme activating protein [Vibrio albus]|uniref:Glycyl-radical enzyme activating protein n=1 Tax=Vibrio albus TaxID=2200953 RepID=A0A2U3B5A3_9VIBR|nr:glycyl-radical enzyme activating protein [Vibrio albus]
METGHYFNIQRFSTHDGDGIRTILFLKGCSLNCPWCQNPESLSAKPSLVFDQRICLDSCSLCTGCPAINREQGDIQIDRTSMSVGDIENLRQVCPAEALCVVGEEAGSEELYELLMRDKPFYDQSGGGVTFSGGEPLLQSGLVAELAQRLQQQNINTAVETCMHVPWKNIERVVPHVDCWLTDLKHVDAEKFQSWTKGSMTRVLANFGRLSNEASRIVIRVPVVPDFNDTEEELQAIIDFAAALPQCHELHLLPYHILGINKYHLLDLPYQCAREPLDKPELLEHAKHYAESNYQLSVTIRG